jgi:hypothetical protein
MSISHGGISVAAGGLSVNSGGLNVLRGGLQVYAGGMSIYSGGLKISNGGLSILSAGFTITGGGAINSAGMTVTGGVTIFSGGLYVTLKGLTIAAGGTKVGGGMTVQSGGVYVSANGMTINSGGIVVLTNGMTVGSNGLVVSNGGMTITNNGLYATGGITVTTSGIQTTGGLTVFDLGAVITGGLTIQDSGLKVIGGGMTVTGNLACSAALDVSGGMTVSGSSGMVVSTGGVLVTAGGMTVYGTTNLQNAAAIIGASDRRLKTNVQPITSALNKVSKIQGVYFDWIKNEPSGRLNLDNRRHSGVMAQEILSVFPEAVSYVPNSGDKYLGVDYTALVPLLIEAIHDLQELMVKKEGKLDSRNKASKVNETCNYQLIKKEMNEMKSDLKQIQESNADLYNQLTLMKIEVDSISNWKTEIAAVPSFVGLNRINKVMTNRMVEFSLPRVKQRILRM